MDLRLPAALIFIAMLPGTAHAQTCTNDEACQDGSWCNGIERCEGTAVKGQCMPALRPMCSDKKVCDEDGKRCLSPEKVEKLLTVCEEGETYSVADNKCVPKPPPAHHQ